jgi:lipopolysaccharide export system protein LptA
MGALLPGAVCALTDDRSQPVQIESDSFEADDLKGVSIYRGNVVYTQGSIRLDADEVKIFLGEDRKVSRVEATGAPVRFRQRMEGYDEDMRGEAGRLQYFTAPDERIVLEHDAHVWRLGTEFFAQTINYDLVHEVVNAQRGEDEAGRVRITIQPRPDQHGKQRGNQQSGNAR